MKKLLLLMPLMALLMGCACSDEDALSPVLTVEGGQIQGGVTSADSREFEWDDEDEY